MHYSLLVIARAMNYGLQPVMDIEYIINTRFQYQLQNTSSSEVGKAFSDHDANLQVSRRLIEFLWQM